MLVLNDESWWRGQKCYPSEWRICRRFYNVSRQHNAILCSGSFSLFLSLPRPLGKAVGPNIPGCSLPFYFFCFPTICSQVLLYYFIRFLSLSAIVFSNGFTTTFLLKVQCKVNEWSLLTDTAEQRKLPALKSSLNLKWSFLPFTWSIKRTEYSHKNVYLQSVFHSKVLFTLSRKCVWFTFKPLARQDKCIGWSPIRFIVNMRQVQQGVLT